MQRVSDASPSRRPAVSTLRWPLAALVAALGMALLLLATGSVDDIQTVLTEIGFDPDRARFLAALSAAAVAGAAGGLVGARRTLPAVVGLGAFWAAFGPAFLAETQAALTSPPDQGAFDALGWALTGATEVTAALIAGWAGAVLASDVRATLVRAGEAVREALRTGRPRRDLARPLAVVLVAIVLAGTLPAFGDVTNFGMDALMRQGAPSGVALVGAAGQATDGSTAAGASTAASSSTADSSSTATAPVIAAGNGNGGPGAVAQTVGSSTPIGAGARPWLSWLPTGGGQVTTITFPAPWTGGRSTTAAVDVYTPPGYSAGSRHYPVIYEVPWAFSYWDSSVHIKTLLDGMITRGEIPAEIVVFVAHNGGPYPDSECVDSVDGREWFDRYVAQTVVPYVDANYRTIATPAGRTVLGFSMGGFCAPVLALHHPDLFGQVVAFSGYYVAGIRSGQTVNAALPFGGSAGAITANSPIDMAPTLPASLRHGMLFVLAGTPGEAFYGPQYLSFAAELRKDGYPLALIPSAIAHSWAQVRDRIPQALRIVAGRQVTEGVFSS